ncbi:hypothetical protein [Burkholderia plantarii]|uniref:hypothetical protein n=1 Tax=Burkholderia plantarii TaxID=41899 RepID=UPI000F4DD062|nr:hypothetical protein [Burkholderia plantarii]
MGCRRCAHGPARRAEAIERPARRSRHAPAAVSRRFDAGRPAGRDRAMGGESGGGQDRRNGCNRNGPPATRAARQRRAGAAAPHRLAGSPDARIVSGSGQIGNSVDVIRLIYRNSGNKYLKKLLAGDGRITDIYTSLHSYTMLSPVKRVI